jgi:hypothetical protein
MQGTVAVRLIGAVGVRNMLMLHRETCASGAPKVMTLISPTIRDKPHNEDFESEMTHLAVVAGPSDGSILCKYFEILILR